jgi:hypothetical protein
MTAIATPMPFHGMFHLLVACSTRQTDKGRRFGNVQAYTRRTAASWDNPRSAGS